MKTLTLYADGFPVASFANEDSAADAKVDAKKASLCADAERRGVPAPEFKTKTHEDAREAQGKKEGA